MAVEAACWLWLTIVLSGWALLIGWVGFARLVRPSERGASSRLESICAVLLLSAFMFFVGWVGLNARDDNLHLVLIIGSIPSLLSGIMGVTLLRRIRGV